MEKSTLHEIMQSVLKRNGGSMYPSDLAEEIREKGLYTQRDKTPLKDGQIQARVSNYPELFIKIDGKVTINDSTIVVKKMKNQSFKPCTKVGKPILKFNDIKIFNSNPLEDWFHESKISRVLVRYLIECNYAIIQDNTENKAAKGVDIIAIKDSVQELVEVKGYPSIYFVNGDKKGQKNKTNPHLQSTHWFSGCLSSTLKNFESKETKLAMAFPACSRYEELVIKNQKYFTENDLDVKVYFIDEQGSITISNLNKNIR